jgi:hypothetical protein
MPAPARTEASIEKAVCEYARARDCMVRKMNGLGYAGWPDRMFITATGHVFWIEFKRPGYEPTPVQYALHERLRDRLHEVFVVDDVAEGKKIVEEQLKCNGRRTTTKKKP